MVGAPVTRAPLSLDSGKFQPKAVFERSRRRRDPVEPRGHGPLRRTAAHEMTRKHRDGPAAGHQIRNNKLFVVAAPVPSRGIRVGQEDVVNMNQDSGRQCRKKSVHDPVDIAARHRDMAGIEKQDTAHGKRRQIFGFDMLDRLVKQCPPSPARSVRGAGST